MIILLF